MEVLRTCLPNYSGVAFYVGLKYSIACIKYSLFKSRVDTFSSSTGRITDSSFVCQMKYLNHSIHIVVGFLIFKILCIIMHIKRQHNREESSFPP